MSRLLERVLKIVISPSSRIQRLGSLVSIPFLINPVIGLVMDTLLVLVPSQGKTLCQPLEKGYICRSPTLEQRCLISIL